VLAAHSCHLFVPRVVHEQEQAFQLCLPGARASFSVPARSQLEATTEAAGRPARGESWPAQNSAGAELGMSRIPGARFEPATLMAFSLRRPPPVIGTVGEVGIRSRRTKAQIRAGVPSTHRRVWWPAQGRCSWILCRNEIHSYVFLASK